MPNGYYFWLFLGLTVNPIETLWTARAGERCALMMPEPKRTSPRLPRLVSKGKKRSKAYEYGVKNEWFLRRCRYVTHLKRCVTSQGTDTRWCVHSIFLQINQDLTDLLSTMNASPILTLLVLILPLITSCLAVTDNNNDGKDSNRACGHSHWMHCSCAPGIPGIPGSPGPAGPAGAAGSPGPRGQAGDKGEAGTLGTPGSTGREGPQGIKGDAGDKGSQGAPGPQGLPGTLGSNWKQCVFKNLNDDRDIGLVKVNNCIRVYLWWVENIFPSFLGCWETETNRHRKVLSHYKAHCD